MRTKEAVEMILSPAVAATKKTMSSVTMMKTMIWIMMTMKRRRKRKIEASTLASLLPPTPENIPLLTIQKKAIQSRTSIGDRNDQIKPKSPFLERLSLNNSACRT
jgi:hypothetical protein